MLSALVLQVFCTPGSLQSRLSAIQAFCTQGFLHSRLSALPDLCPTDSLHSHFRPSALAHQSFCSLGSLHSGLSALQRLCAPGSLPFRLFPLPDLCPPGPLHSHFRPSDPALQSSCTPVSLCSRLSALTLPAFCPCTSALCALGSLHSHVSAFQAHCPSVSFQSQLSAPPGSLPCCLPKLFRLSALTLQAFCPCPSVLLHSGLSALQTLCPLVSMHSSKN